MRISDALVEKLLRETGNYTDEQLKTLHDQAVNQKQPAQDIAVQSNLVSEADLTKLYAKAIDVPYVEFNAPDLKRDIVQLIPEKVARQYHAAAFDLTQDGVIMVAMEDPDDVQAINILQKQLAKPIRVHIAPASVIQSVVELYSGSNVSTELAKVIAVEDKETESENVAEEDVAEDSPIAQTVNLIIDYGINSRASDIHIEPRENEVSVRYRIDGDLHEGNKLPRKVMAALISRVKILANLKIDEHRAPQDGRFKIAIRDHAYALRVSTLPIIDGEKVAMRILDESSKAATFEELGYWGESLTRLQHAIQRPHGLILVTGPTGSGKSTSLFSILSKLNKPTVNISTIEDPVEYHIIGVNQTQVNPVAGMTFASGLRSLLRQDPNIIMVGEVRDGETADLAVQAALTGHLVFTTLHTNNAATALPRLLDMGVEPFLIASTIRVIVGQRLVRRLCTVCRQPYVPDEALVERIKHTFGLGNEGDLGRIHNLEVVAIAAGIGAKDNAQQNIDTLEKPNADNNTIGKLWQAHENGCNVCNHTGYLGRMGIYEVLSSTDGIQKLIISNTSSEDLEAQAVRDGMVTMQIDGLIKALRGQTTLEEIMRVTSEDG